MNQLAIKHNLQIGDRLIRTKGVVSTHHGIYVGVHNGIALVAENQVGHGVRYITLAEFLLYNASNLKEIRRYKGSETWRRGIIEYINSILGWKYDLINFNCEHFAELIQNGVPKSSQVNNTLSGLGSAMLLFGFFALISKR